MNSVQKTAILLLQLGTPDSPSTADVRKYLSQFLNDPRVIDLPWLQRKLLVNGIIVPFRASKSAVVYKQLWTDNGSPLLYYANRVKEMLQEKLKDKNIAVEFAMRYRNPSIPDVLEKMRQKNYTRIVVFPLFPQYASSTTGSAFQQVMEEIGKWWVIPSLHFISQYHNHPSFIKAFAVNGRKYSVSSYEHVLFSFHGLPVRHVDKVYTDGKKCKEHACENEWNEENYYCYKATCFDTAKRIADSMQIPATNYSVAFQSRLGKEPWIEPYADESIRDLAQKGIKKLLVFSPAFTADCLETTIEIGHEYLELFRKHGGETLQLVESLNDSPAWIEAIENITQVYC